ncbi:YdcH family protein [Alteraurantiacibacter palmitatis]|uniref:YdcH family protein n=1 Tax=Alteraurantiacibacter palmitatis TaxID=2054628 RepID=A0ABV7E6J7_9SPHN
MSHTPHELAAEFPQDAAAIHALKTQDAHFAKLADAYHDLNREIHRIESEIEAASDERTEMLKKKRLALLDEISPMIAKARAAAV